MRKTNIERCSCGNITRVKGLCFACYSKQRRQENPERYQKQRQRGYQKQLEKNRIRNSIRHFFKNMGGRLIIENKKSLSSKHIWRTEYMCSKCKRVHKGHRVFINGKTYCITCKHQIEDRKKADELFRLNQAQEQINSIDPFGKLREECTKLGTCDILHFHREILKDDPERLRTDFLIELICGHEKVEVYQTKKDARVSHSE